MVHPVVSLEAGIWFCTMVSAVPASTQPAKSSAVQAIVSGVTFIIVVELLLAMAKLRFLLLANRSRHESGHVLGGPTHGVHANVGAGIERLALAEQPGSHRERILGAVEQRSPRRTAGPPQHLERGGRQRHHGSPGQHGL